MPTLSNAPPSKPPLLWGQDQIVGAAGSRVPWIWQGLLLPGAVTLLTSSWKSGKTTLVSVLVARRQSQCEFAGLPLAPGRSVIVSEEHPDHWRRRSDLLNFGDRVGWFCRPFMGQPTPAQWNALIDELVVLRVQRGVDLVVIDPLAAFMSGGSENDAGCMLQTLQPLQRLTSSGVSVLVLHHPRRRAAPVGQAARGSGALSGFADILMEMRWLHGPTPGDRRRRLIGLSRYPQTPDELVIALTADGTDYRGLGDVKTADFAEHWPVLEFILATAPAPLDRLEIYKSWPTHPIALVVAPSPDDAVVPVVARSLPVVAQSPEYPVVARSPDRATESDRRSPPPHDTLDASTVAAPSHDRITEYARRSPPLFVSPDEIVGARSYDTPVVTRSPDRGTAPDQPVAERSPDPATEPDRRSPQNPQEASQTPVLSTPPPRPELDRIKEWLETAVTKNMIKKIGRGVKNHRFRYYLPSRMEEWRQDPMKVLCMPELFRPGM